MKMTGKDWIGNMTDLVLRPLPSYGEHITMEKYIEWIEHGYITDYDGHGNYATEAQVTNFVTRPSDLKEGLLRKDEFTHVVWYNR